MGKKIIEDSNRKRVIEVEADTLYDFLYDEAAERCNELEEIGPFAPKQERPFLKAKQNILVGCVIVTCIALHIWAMATIGM